MGSRGAALALGALASLACLCGCGGPSYELAKVKGIVRLDGVPLANVRVEFVPEATGGLSASTVPISTATTGPQGEFELQLLGGRAGAAVGQHRVVVEDLSAAGSGRSREEEDESPAEPIPSRVAAVYRLVAKTPLRVEVKPGDQTIDLELNIAAK